MVGVSRLTWLCGPSNAVSGALDLVGALLEGGLLAIRLQVGSGLVGGGLAAGEVVSTMRDGEAPGDTYRASDILAVLRLVWCLV